MLPMEPAAETPEATVETATEKKLYPTYQNREDILTRLAEIVSETSDEVKSEIGYLKLQYYKLRQQETDAALQALIDGDGDASQYEAKADELEPRLKELLTIQKEARAVMVEARNKEMAENLEKKTELLRQMEAIALDADNVGQKYNEFQELQKQFKAVGIDRKSVV